MHRDAQQGNSSEMVALEAIVYMASLRLKFDYNLGKCLMLKHFCGDDVI